MRTRCQLQMVGRLGTPHRAVNAPRVWKQHLVPCRAARKTRDSGSWTCWTSRRAQMKRDRPGRPRRRALYNILTLDIIELIDLIEPFETYGNMELTFSSIVFSYFNHFGSLQVLVDCFWHADSNMSFFISCWCLESPWTLSKSVR